MLSALTPLLIATLPGCGDIIKEYDVVYVESSAGAGGGTATDGGGNGDDNSPASGDGGSEPVVQQGGAGGVDVLPDPGHDRYPDAPYATTTVEEQELDIFETVGTKFYFGVSRDQLDSMNPVPIVDDALSPYSPGSRSGDTVSFTDYLWVTAPGGNGSTANYGRIKTKVVGGSTLRNWDRNSIPNLNIDTDEFVPKQRIDGYEHLRLNNAQVGGIFREWLSLRLIHLLGYPAAQASFAMVSSNVWGLGVEVPMVLVERYKRQFCKRIEAWGSRCNNMWDLTIAFVVRPDPAPGAEVPPLPVSAFDEARACRFDTCNNDRAKELEALAYRTPSGPGFKAALASYLDWPAFHRYQCISWVLAIGDDVVHDTNNIVLAEGADGKFRFLPYSTDISLGHADFPFVPLEGDSKFKDRSLNIARGCRADQQCWAETLSTCEGVIADFTALDPLNLLRELHTTLSDRGMLRPGDEEEYETLQAWFESRLANLPKELESYR